MHRRSDEHPQGPEALTERIRAGDVAAFEALFRAHYRGLCGFVRQQVGSIEAAEEIVQDVFLRTWQARDRLDPGQSLRAYLYRSALNAAYNELKHRGVERRWAEASGAQTSAHSPTDDPVETRELSEAVQRSVAALPERCRLVFRMSREQGLTYLEIAEALDISVKTVETQMGRALKALRAGLAAYLA